MTEARALALGLVTYRLEPPPGWRVVEEDPRYAAFLVDEAAVAAAIPVRLRAEDPGPPPAGAPLFDTVDAWTAWRDGDDLVVHMAPAAAGPPLWSARVTRDGAVEVHCGAALRREQARELQNPLRYPLDQVLATQMLPPQGALVVHGAGGLRSGRAFAFPGRSGAGKSTLMRLMRSRPEVVGLSDDRVVLQAPTPDAAAYAYGTPWAGDEQVSSPSSGPLAALVFLHHASADRLVPIEARSAAAQLLPTLCIPWFDAERVAQGLAICDALVRAVPCYELHFRPVPESLQVLDVLW